MALACNTSLQQLGEASPRPPGLLQICSPGDLGLYPTVPSAFLLLLSSSRSKGAERCGEGPGELGSCSAEDHGEHSSQRKHLGLGQLCPGAPHLVTTGFLPDLRWNSIGLLGGRALVNCLPRNRGLWKLELAGNSIPGDILRAVGMGTRGCRWPARFGAGRLTGPATEGGAAPGPGRGRGTASGGWPEPETGRRGRRCLGKGMVAGSSWGTSLVAL